MVPWRWLGMLGVLLMLLLWATSAIRGLFLMRLYALSFDVAALIRLLTPAAWLLALNGPHALPKKETGGESIDVTSLYDSLKVISGTQSEVRRCHKATSM